MRKDSLTKLIAILLFVGILGGLAITYLNCSFSSSRVCQDKDCVLTPLGFQTRSTPIQNCCGNNQCEMSGIYKETFESCSKDCKTCDDDNICTEDNYDYTTQTCNNKPINNCCGNNICETSETPLNCKKDCAASIEISDIRVRVDDPEKSEEFTDAEYEEGQIYRFDELKHGSNVGRIHLKITNTGKTFIEDLHAEIQCWDEDYQLHSKDICWVIPDKMDESICQPLFYLPSPGTILDSSVKDSARQESPRLKHMPIDGEARFQLYLSPLNHLEYFREDHDEDLFHNIECNIHILSDKSGIKERVDVKNYRVRPDIHRWGGLTS